MAARRRVAVVLFNLGGPDSPKAVRPFLFNLFRDPAIITAPGPARLAIAGLIAMTRTRSARANYALMGGASPLLKETESQADALRARLAQALPDCITEVFVGMRYWRPFVHEAAEAVKRFAPDEVVLLPLYPQFSTTTTASSLAAWSRAYKGPGQVRAVCCYPDEDGLVDAHARRIETAWIAAGRPENVRLLFSAHGLPQKVVDAGDPYQWQVERTCAAVAARLGPEFTDWKICYQSRVGPLKWLGPSTPEAIEEAGHEGRGVVITPIAFVSEHIETLVELDHEYALVAEQAGCETYVRVPAITLEPAFIGGLETMVTTVLAGRAPIESASGGRICPKTFAKCPSQSQDQAAP